MGIGDHFLNLKMRKTIFANEEVYHVFNLGIERRPVFTSKREYDRALLALDFYRFRDLPIGLAEFLRLEQSERTSFFSRLLEKNEKRVDIFAYSLMPNHFHILVKQLTDEGITKFLSDFSNSHTRYFNIKHQRSGHLFQGAFKTVRVENDDQFIHVWRYISINPTVSFLVKEVDLENYPYSSLSEYLGKKKGFCNKDFVLGYFSSIEKLKTFVYDQIDYGKKLEAIKHLILE